MGASYYQRHIMGPYTRRCRRCNALFETAHFYSKVCQACCKCKSLDVQKPRRYHAIAPCEPIPLDRDALQAVTHPCRCKICGREFRAPNAHYRMCCDCFGDGFDQRHRR